MRDMLRDEVDLTLIEVYMGKDFDPNQPRDPHTGEWIDVPGSDVSIQYPEGLAVAAAGWRESLTQREAHAVADYKADVTGDVSLDNEALSSAIDKGSLPEATTVYRAFEMPSGGIHDGSVVSTGDFISTTLERGIAEMNQAETVRARAIIAGRDSPQVAIAEIRLRAGTHVAYPDAFQTHMTGEAELLLNPTDMRVVEVVKSNGETWVRVELLR